MSDKAEVKRLRADNRILNMRLEIMEAADRKLRDAFQEWCGGGDDENQDLERLRAEVDRLNTLLLKQLGGRGDDR